MNVCSFTGFVSDDPVLNKSNGVSVINFTLVTYTYRIPSFLKFEAWHTGAETIARFAKKGSKLSIVASARNVSRDNKDVVFRVNEFDFANVEYENLPESNYNA